jgi:tetratricopeptide (TPR) repeat protein
MMAVVGDDVGVEQLGVLLPGVDVAAGVAELIDVALLRQESGRLRWTHPLYREIGQSAIPSLVRKDLYRTVCDAADQLGAPLEARAHYAVQAERSIEALFLLEQVAERSLALDDMAGAVQALQQGLEVARLQMAQGELDNPTQTVEMFGRKLGETLLEAGRLAEAEGVLREVLGMASGDSPELVRVVRALSRVLEQRGNSDPALERLLSGLEDPRTSVRRNMAAMLETLRRGVAS